MTKVLGAVAGAAVLAVVILGAYRLYGKVQARDLSQCPLCHRPNHALTAFSAIVEGKQVRVCCPRCWLTFVRQADGAVGQPMATDYATGRPVEAERCVYVEGSDTCPCCTAKIIIGTSEKVPAAECFDRCMPSVIAFAKAEDAAAFADRHGGVVISYETFLDEAKKR